MKSDVSSGPAALPGLVESFPVLSEDIWEFPLADFLVLARRAAQGLYILSPAARVLWELFKTGADQAEAIYKFASHYSIPLDIAARDVSRTLQDWRFGLLAPVQDDNNRPSVPCAPVPTNAFSRVYSVSGRSARVVLHDRAAAEEIAPRLEACASHCSAEPEFTFHVAPLSIGYGVFCGPDLLALEATVTAARAILLQELVRGSRPTDWRAVFHAAACGLDSRCLVFPAATQSGKSTLAAALAADGFTLYTEDSAVVDENWTIPPMPFAIMLREGSWPLLQPRYPELDDAPVFTRFGQRIKYLYPETGAASANVAAFIFSRYEASAATTLARLDPLRSLVRLNESGFWVPHQRERIAEFLAWIESVPSYSFTYSDVDDAAFALRRLLA